MSAPREVELKLRLPEAGAEALPRMPPLKDLPRETARLDATYFDTADRLLQRNAMALRLRRIGRRWVQTLKATESSQGGLSSRPEWEMPARLIRGHPRIDVARLQNTPLPGLLTRHAESGPLVPAFRTRFVRTAWLVELGESRIEVAVDRGRIEAKRGRKRVTAPIAELELELKAGDVADLFRLASEIVARSRLALVPIVRSKAERGYRLADATTPAPAKASARGFVDALEPGMTKAAALRAVIAHGLGVLLANTDALRDFNDPEYVHQARVALRRMRSALRLLDRRQADFPAPLADEMRWVGRLLGEARDWDVFESQTLPALVADSRADFGPGLDALLQRARARREAAHSRVVAQLGSARYARFVLQLHAWTLTAPPAGRVLAQIAPRALRKASAELFDAARFFAALSSERRHRVRILAKRLRYALDLLSVALPGPSTARYIAALSELQDVLGELNDTVVALGTLRRLTRSRAVLAAARVWADARTREKALAAEQKLLALAETAQPWR